MNTLQAVARILKTEGVEWLSCFPSNNLIEAVSGIKSDSNRASVRRYEVGTHVQTSEKRPVCIVFYLIGHSAGDVSRAYRRRGAEVVHEDGVEKIREGHEGTTGGWLECPWL